MRLYRLLVAACIALSVTACGGEPDIDAGQKPEVCPPGGDTPGTGDEVADREGKMIKGRVHCGGEPLAGVAVSDGREVTLTDSEGRYWLDGDKSCGYVFVCNPKGYKAEGFYPQFYRTLSGGAAVVERHDFGLKEDKSGSYGVVFLADIQMSGRNNDESQFMTYLLPDVNATVAGLEAKGRTVYAVTLGDQSYDKYWVSNSWGIPESKKCIDMIKAGALWNCMGNHDNNPTIAGDWAASVTYRQFWGPTYYSFNAGDVHFVVLDNIVYKNADCSSRDYDVDIDSKQMEWLRADLSKVPSDKPVVVCMHAPFYNKPKVDGSGNADAASLRYGYGQALYDCLKGFKDVRVMTGHSHTGYTRAMGTVTEYNNAAASGDLWWTGRNSFVPGNHICKDGTVGGYRVLEIDGSSLSTYWKGVGFDADNQFRAYDLNNCHITADRFCPGAKYSSELATWLKEGKYGYDSSEYNADGTPKTPDKVLVNVFGYGPGWSVSVSENGRELPVKRVYRYDPLFIISGACERLDNNNQLIGTTSFDPVKQGHFFEARATAPNTTLTITVRDSEGRTYTGQITRPAEFSISAYMP